MPKVLERKLRAEAKRKFPGDPERQDRYVYGTLSKVKERGQLHKGGAGHHV